MRAFTAMLQTSLRAFLRDRTAVFWGVVFPLLLMGLIGLAFGRADTLEFTVSLVDEGNPQIAGPLREGLAQVPVFKVREEGREQALAALRKGDRTLVIVVPARGTALEVFYEQGQQQSGTTALMILERFVAEANLRIGGVTPLLTVRTAAVAGDQPKFFDFLLPGILAMTIAQTGLMSVSYVVATMRERLLLKRVMATPVAPLAFLGGLTGRFTVVQLVQVAIIFLVGTFAFGAQTRGSIPALAGLAVVGSVTFFALGFAISTVSRSADSANLLGSVVNFPMMFLSGTFWPREFMPEAIRPVIAYLPLSPLVDAMRGVGARGEAVTQYWWAVAYLGLWAVGAFVVAARRFRWE